MCVMQHPSPQYIVGGHVGGHDPLVCPMPGDEASPRSRNILLQAACPQRNVPFSLASLRLCTVAVKVSSCPAVISGSAHLSLIFSRLVSARLRELSRVAGTDETWRQSAASYRARVFPSGGLSLARHLP